MKNLMMLLMLSLLFSCADRVDPPLDVRSEIVGQWKLFMLYQDGYGFPVSNSSSELVYEFQEDGRFFASGDETWQSEWAYANDTLSIKSDLDYYDVLVTDNGNLYMTNMKKNIVGNSAFYPNLYTTTEITYRFRKR